MDSVSKFNGIIHTVDPIMPVPGLRVKKILHFFPKNIKFRNISQIVKLCFDLLFSLCYHFLHLERRILIDFIDIHLTIQNIAGIQRKPHSCRNPVDIKFLFFHGFNIFYHDSI